MADASASTFRAGVGLVVMNGAGEVLALERADVRGAWQLPQGGLEAGEAPESAAWRELREETGLEPRHVELVDSLDVWMGYELPVDLRSPKTGRGQVHRWFLFRLRDGASLPGIENAGGEFVDHHWTSLRTLAERAVEFRRPVYRILADRFG
jgi:putative (di)nucleoside polyphosphate hydrolase